MHSNKDKSDAHEADGVKENSFQARMELPKHNSLDKECKWVCPEFSPITGIGEGDLWTLKGLIVAIGFIDDQKQQVIGSGVMVAPGLCLTATHVLEGLTNQPFLHSFVTKTAMRIWIVEDFHAQAFKVELVPFQASKRKFSDVCVLSCSPFSAFSDDEPFYFAPIEASIPKIGERFWTVGYREKANDGVPMIGCFTSSGLVTEIYLNGRGSFMKGPCVEVAMNVVGGTLPSEPPRKDALWCHSPRKSLRELGRNMTTSELNWASLRNKQYASAPSLPPIFPTTF